MKYVEKASLIHTKYNIQFYSHFNTTLQSIMTIKRRYVEQTFELSSRTFQEIEDISTSFGFDVAVGLALFSREMKDPSKEE